MVTLSEKLYDGKFRIAQRENNGQVEFAVIEEGTQRQVCGYCKYKNITDVADDCIIAEWQEGLFMLRPLDRTVAYLGGNGNEPIVEIKHVAKQTFAYKKRGESKFYLYNLRFPHCFGKAYTSIKPLSETLIVAYDNGQRLWSFIHTNRINLDPIYETQNEPRYNDEAQTVAFNGFVGVNAGCEDILLGYDGVRKDKASDDSDFSQREVNKRLNASNDLNIPEGHDITKANDTSNEEKILLKCIDFVPNHNENLDGKSISLPIVRVDGRDGMVCWIIQNQKRFFVVPHKRSDGLSFGCHVSPIIDEELSDRLQAISHDQERIPCSPCIESDRSHLQEQVADWLEQRWKKQQEKRYVPKSTKKKEGTHMGKSVPVKKTLPSAKNEDYPTKKSKTVVADNSSITTTVADGSFVLSLSGNDYHLDSTIPYSSFKKGKAAQSTDQFRYIEKGSDVCIFLTKEQARSFDDAKQPLIVLKGSGDTPQHIGKNVNGKIVKSGEKANACRLYVFVRKDENSCTLFDEFCLHSEPLVTGRYIYFVFRSLWRYRAK